MFKKLKEKLSGFTKSLDKTVEEKAVELSEPEIVEELVEKVNDETIGGLLEKTDSANIQKEEKDKETVNENASEKLKESEKESKSESETKLKIESETKSETKSETEYETKPESEKIDSGVKTAPDGNAGENTDISASKSFVSTDSNAVQKEKAGFLGKAKALIFDREVILDEEDLEGPLTELEIALLESDLALSVTDVIVDSVRKQLSGTRKKLGKNTGSIVENALKNAILEVMSANVFDFDDFLEQRRGQTVHIAFVGINGTGKTTSIAKIANRLQKNGYSVTIAAGDTFRAGAIDQIQIHADRLGIKVIKHKEGSDPAAVIYDALQYSKAHKINVLLSDTAGRMHTNVNLMAQLEKICRVSSPDLIIFVDEATAGNDAVERASQFNGAVPIHGTILTKLDADSKGGAAISIAYITQKPILFFGIGQEYDDLLKFDPKWFVEKIFED